MKSQQRRINERAIAAEHYKSVIILCVQLLILTTSALGLAVVIGAAMASVTEIGNVLDQAQQLKGY